MGSSVGKFRASVHSQKTTYLCCDIWLKFFEKFCVNFGKLASILRRMALKIKISYCGGWGYEPKFRKVKQALEERFPGKIDITGDKIPGMSGKFEVELEDGQMLHSKINGDGYVDTPAKLDKIAQGIENALK